MKKNNKTPKLRFSGYTDDWEQRKLGDVAQEFKSGNSLKADKIDITGDYPVYGGNGLRGYTSTYNHDGEYALIGRQGALCGNMNYSVGKAYFTEHAVVVKADANNDTRFLYYMLDTMNLGQYSDQSAQPGLAVNKLVKLENRFPIKEEQQRIGWYFSNLDHLITLHQRKLEKLQNMKKSCLQKMFPKDGATVPEIRFSEFQGDWEERTLGSCFDERLESLPDGELLSVTIGSGIKKFSELDRHDNSNTDKSKYKRVCIGDIAYNSMRMWQGASGRSPYEGIVSPAYTVVKPIGDIDTQFFAYMFKKKEIIHLFEINSQGLTSDTWNLKYPAFSKIVVRVPRNVEEQSRIARFLLKLDELISCAEQEIEITKRMKKGCLQKMFV